MNPRDKCSWGWTSSRFSKARRINWLLIAATLAGVSIVVALTVSVRWWVHQSTHDLIHTQVQWILDGFETAGLDVQEPRILEGVTGVRQAVEVDVNGNPVRILEFDPGDAFHAQILEQIRRDHSTRLFGSAMPAEDNGSIALVDYEKHPSKNKLLESFRNCRMKAEGGTSQISKPCPTENAEAD